MTQNEKVLQYMKDFGSISTMQAFMDLGVTRLSARIADLKREGHPIVSEMRSGKNRYGDKVHFAEYYIKNY